MTDASKSVREHSMSCEYPEGCSCGAAEYNALLAELDEAKADKEREQAAAALWSKECRLICDALAKLAGLPVDPTPGWKNSLATLTRQRDNEVWMHAACLSIAEGLPCEETDAAVQASPATRAVYAQRKKVESLTRQRDGLKEAIPFPDLSANSADAIAYELECEHPKYTTTKEAKAVWLRDMAKQLRAFDAARKEQG